MKISSLLSKKPKKIFFNYNYSQIIESNSKIIPIYVLPILLITIISWQLSKIFWLFFTDDATREKIKIPKLMSKAIIAESQVQPNNQNISSILSAHLFGLSFSHENNPALIKTTELAIENLIETNLSLLLIGTIKDNNNKLSMAIIINDQKEEQVYKINDEILPNIILHSIYPDQIVLRRNGILESLKLPKNKHDDIFLINNNRAANKTNSTFNNRGPMALQTDIADLLKPTPYFENGKQKGYKIYPGGNSQQLENFGLINGDLVTHINGSPLDNPLLAMKMFQDMKMARQLSLTIERNKQRTDVVINLNQFNQ
jgi:general secretion pathway protein C|tara:strand:- start:366 stop:1307 length:942 start_codon:yes stop_codon:yes gene_type:complete